MEGAMCRNCDYCHVVRLVDIRNPNDGGEGECRANPPSIFLVPVQSLQGQGVGFSSQFPRISLDCYCGNFTERELAESIDVV